MTTPPLAHLALPGRGVRILINPLPFGERASHCRMARRGRGVALALIEKYSIEKGLVCETNPFCGSRVPRPQPSRARLFSFLRTCRQITALRPDYVLRVSQSTALETLAPEVRSSAGRREKTCGIPDKHEDAQTRTRRAASGASY
jgi:hypothetical protein